MRAGEVILIAILVGGSIGALALGNPVIASGLAGAAAGFISRPPPAPPAPAPVTPPPDPNRSNQP